MDDATGFGASVVEFLGGPDAPNVGGLDRVWRAVAGPLVLAGVAAALLGVLDVGAGPAAWALLAAGLFVGAVVTHSAVARRCRINYLAGIDTSE